MSYDSSGKWIPEKDNVSDAVADVYSEDSILNKRAQGAGKRGLQNTSMGVQSGEAAVLDRAVEIGTQQASQANQKNLAAQGFSQDTLLQESDFEGRRGLHCPRRAEQLHRDARRVLSLIKTWGLPARRGTLYHPASCCV